MQHTFHLIVPQFRCNIVTEQHITDTTDVLAPNEFLHRSVATSRVNTMLAVDGIDKLSGGPYASIRKPQERGCRCIQESVPGTEGFGNRVLGRLYDGCRPSSR